MRPFLARVAGLVLLLPLVAVPAAAAPADPAPVVPPYHPTMLTHLGGDTTQVVVVSAAGWRSTDGELRAYSTNRKGQWKLRLGPVPVQLGPAGMVRQTKRIALFPTTPAGTFRLLAGFGAKPDPGTRLYRYVWTERGDYWWPLDAESPATYNVLQPRRSAKAHWKRGRAVRLISGALSRYRYGVMVDYNVPCCVHRSRRQKQFVASEPADPARGGAFFLQVKDNAPTNGSVALAGSNMKLLLQFLDASRSPRLVVGPLNKLPNL